MIVFIFRMRSIFLTTLKSSGLGDNSSPSDFLLWIFNDESSIASKSELNLGGSGVGGLGGGEGVRSTGTYCFVGLVGGRAVMYASELSIDVSSGIGCCSSPDDLISSCGG
ncbi:unnamed protein product [Ambrosiozyma monospora]|uniref:Unnamed protein product n=1 Tax=Ambrosiozyma monospora TaxID=43982 RepID=A0ACB5UDF6_AMBMO|nr:unnamed protein product [Ambrosiozyma monospora]